MPTFISWRDEFRVMQDNGLDPVTGEALSAEDLISVKTNKV